MAVVARLDPAALQLVAVTDSLRDGVDGLVGRAVAAVEGGATMVQLRLKDEPPRTLVEVARAMRGALPRTPIVVNHRADVALASDANGVHLGTDDIAPALLRDAVPSAFLIGASVCAEHEVERAAGADYVAIGPVYATGAAQRESAVLGVTRFGDLARRCAAPVVAIGGITPENAGEVMAAGAAGVAVISALLSAPDPRAVARALRAAARDASGR